MSCPRNSKDNEVGSHHDHGNAHTIWEEILHHLPFAIFSVSLAMICLSLLTFSSGDSGGTHSHDSIIYMLFHNFHFIHLLFAGTGTVLSFRKYSKNTLWGLLVGFLVPTFFCSFSDAVLPYLGGKMLGLDMNFHWCFLQHLDIVLPFLLIGILNGWVMSNHKESAQIFYSVGFHFFHIFISSMASILYLVSFGFHDWWTHMGIVFMYMIGAVLIPCTLADIVIPILFARKKQ